ncbi:MAG: nucleotide exchange factor GrpE [Sphingomonadaceae bacterium]|nr:nucleotide exchange factor GrpE [Sphingomonadaceae bacterium]
MNGGKTESETEIAGKAEFEEELADIPFAGLEDGKEQEEGAGGDLGARVVQLESDLAAARQEVLYARAEEQNTRRRLEAEKTNASTYAATAFAREILSVADNLDRALAAIPEELRADERMKGLIAGIEATGKELESIFRKHGIEAIEAMGRPLDPHWHQAMIELPSDEAEPGTIVQEMQKGYRIKERLLRPSLVGVAKKGG